MSISTNNKEDREQERARIKAELDFYRQARREYIINPKRVQSGTNGANQHTVEYHSLLELETVIKNLEEEYRRYQPRARNIGVAKSRGEIW